MRVISAIVNGIRAAAHRGAMPWLLAQRPDVLCVQEVRASDTDLLKALAGAGFGDWHVAHTECTSKGRAGVAVASRAGHRGQRIGIEDGFVAHALGRGRSRDVGRAGHDRLGLRAYRRGRDRAAAREVRIPRREVRGRHEPQPPMSLMLVTGDLNVATRASVGRAPTYAERWSDHASVRVDFDL